MKRALLCGMLGFALSAVAAGDSAAYRVARTLDVPGEGNWDYIVFDAASERIYLPHGSHVDVLDPKAGKPLGVIENTPGVHGIAVIDAMNRGFVTNGHADTISVIDLQTLKHVEEIKGGKDPDSILFEPFTQRIFVSNGDSSDITVIDPRTNKVISTIPADGAPEYAASDGAGRMWVNLQDKNMVVEVDPKAMKIIKRIPVAGCSQPTAMALDKVNKRLFLGCRNSILAVVDPDSGKQVTQLAIGDHADGTVYDARQHLIFASSGDGYLTILKQHSADEYSTEAKIPTRRGAKTLALDGATGTLYLPTMTKVPAPAYGPPRASGPLKYPPSPLVLLVMERGGS